MNGPFPRGTAPIVDAAAALLRACDAADPENGDMLATLIQFTAGLVERDRKEAFAALVPGAGRSDEEHDAREIAHRS